MGVGRARGVPGALNTGGDLLTGGAAEGAGDGPGEVVVGAGGARPLPRVVSVGQGEGRAGGGVGSNHLSQGVDICNKNICTVLAFLSSLAFLFRREKIGISA